MTGPSNAQRVPDERRAAAIVRAEEGLIDAIVVGCLVCEDYGGDFPGLLSYALAAAATALGATDLDSARDVLTRSRPGSWEAELVRQLVGGM